MHRPGRPLMSEFLAAERSAAARREADGTHVPLRDRLVPKRRQRWMMLPWAIGTLPLYLAFFAWAFLWRGPGPGRYSTMPFWLPFVNLLPMVGHLRLAAEVRRVRKRIADGHCRRCGYDLRATPGRCPECGEDPPPADLVAAARSDEADGSGRFGTAGWQGRPNRWVIVGLAAIVLVPLGLIGSDAFRRHRQQAAADAFVARVMPGLGADPRFASVQVMPLTALGEIDVFGVIDSDADQAALKAAVDAAGPPLPVKWQTTVLHPAGPPTSGPGPSP